VHAVALARVLLVAAHEEARVQQTVPAHLQVAAVVADVEPQPSRFQT
jgi:hypothetical protein